MHGDVHGVEGVLVGFDGRGEVPVFHVRVARVFEAAACLETAFRRGVWLGVAFAEVGDDGIVEGAGDGDGAEVFHEDERVEEEMLRGAGEQGAGVRRVEVLDVDGDEEMAVELPVGEVGVVPEFAEEVKVLCADDDVGFDGGVDGALEFMWGYVHADGCVDRVESQGVVASCDYRDHALVGDMGLGLLPEGGDLDEGVASAENFGGFIVELAVDTDNSNVEGVVVGGTVAVIVTVVVGGEELGEDAGAKLNGESKESRLI